MRTHRFYSPVEIVLGSSLTLPKEASHHCVQVLRYQVGAELCLFNGDGFDYIAKVTQIDGKQCQVTIVDRLNPANESPLKIHLLQSIARGEKMDLIIQKAVELGVEQITPIFSERCNVKLDPKRLLKKTKHWQGVSISACEQSGRSIIPAINQPIDLKQLTPEHANGGIYLEPTASNGLQRCFSASKQLTSKVNLFIGPEGGFSDGDISLLKALGAEGAVLGTRILRTETAGLACIAILQSHFGDL